jgi:predicted dehydrogenase/threonine dehydrogenase-like Zn-dependent dehydrogenase
VKQVLQSLQSGTTEVADVPAPGVSSGSVLISTSRTLISSGTERMLVDFGKASLLDKARQQPERVTMVLDKVRTDGLLPTIAAVRNKLDQPLPLGYCNVGTVIAVGAGVTGLSAGDRVASNGKHAEVVNVPKNLCARVPDRVSDDEAAFTVLGAIALQGIRLAQPTLGETVVVTGLGLVGLMTVQLLRAQGCRVLGIDFDETKLAFARQFGADVVDLSRGADPVREAIEFSRGRGVDAVILTASTSSSEPMHQAALMCRQRGRIVLVGVVGLELSRDDFYRKELTFQVSSSYGPGRYDPDYEEKGQDYPVGFVRWTEQRNFEAVLDMMADGHLDVVPLISHRFSIERAADAYGLISGGAPSLGVVLEYPAPILDVSRHVLLPPVAVAHRSDAPSVSFIGAGNYATAVLIPAFRAARARLRTVVSQNGVSGLHAARKFGFAGASTESDVVLRDAGTDTVVVTTRHDSHARIVGAAISAGKNVFVEKPLCLTQDELTEIVTLYATRAESGTAPRVMVGFNRRFAPHVVRIKRLLNATTEPKAFVMTVNAGALPADHWTQDLVVGGGRIIGEGCHFVDLLRFLAGVPIVSHHGSLMRAQTNDTASIHLGFADGSIGTIHYLANGSKRFPKERLDVFVAGRVLHLDNYRKLRGFGWPDFYSMNLWQQDKGQRACAAAFVQAIRDGAPSPIPFDEIVEVSQTTIDIARQIG